MSMALAQLHPDGKQNRNYRWHLSAVPGPPDRPPGFAVVFAHGGPRRDLSPGLGKLANLGPEVATWAKRRRA